MRYITLFILFFCSVGVHADKVMRFTTSSHMNAFPGVVELFTKAYSKIGYEVEFIKLPDRRALYEAEHRDDIDGELARVKDAEKVLPHLIRIPVPITTIAVSAFVKNFRPNINSWKSLSPYKLGSLQGIIATEKKLAGFDVIDVGSPQQLLKMLEKRRIQIAVMPRPMGNLALKKLGYNIRIIEPPIDTFQLYHYVNKKHRSLVPSLTAVLSELTHY